MLQSLFSIFVCFIKPRSSWNERLQPFSRFSLVHRKKIFIHTTYLLFKSWWHFICIIMVDELHEQSTILLKRSFFRSLLFFFNSISIYCRCCMFNLYIYIFYSQLRLLILNNENVIFKLYENYYARNYSQ